MTVVGARLGGGDLRQEALAVGRDDELAHRVAGADGSGKSASGTPASKSAPAVTATCDSWPVAVAKKISLPSRLQTGKKPPPSRAASGGRGPGTAGRRSRRRPTRPTAGRASGRRARRSARNSAKPGVCGDRRPRRRWRERSRTNRSPCPFDFGEDEPLAVGSHRERAMITSAARCSSSLAPIASGRTRGSTCHPLPRARRRDVRRRAKRAGQSRPRARR